MKLSIVVPVFNEAENLRLLHRRLAAPVSSQADDYEVIFVDDGSTDQSLSIMQELAGADRHVRYISFSRNFGHELASTAGLDAARGDAVILMDADLQDPPELIPELVARWKAGAEVVYARRQSRQGESAFKKGTAYLFYRLLNRLAEVDIPLDCGDFRLMDRRVVEVIRRCPENPRFMRGLVAWMGFRQAAVEYARPPRHAGETKYGFLKLMRLSVEAVCAFSLAPLRLVMSLGFIVTVLSLLLAGVVGAQKLFFNLSIPGYAMVACGLFFLGGIQLTMLGIIGRYVGYIFKGVQDRPLYVVAQRGGWENDHGGSPLSRDA